MNVKDHSDCRVEKMNSSRELPIVVSSHLMNLNSLLCFMQEGGFPPTPIPNPGPDPSPDPFPNPEPIPNPPPQPPIPPTPPIPKI